MCLDGLTVELTITQISQNFVIWLFIAAMVSSHHVLNDCTVPLFNSTFKISLWSKTDSSVSLTLEYSLGFVMEDPFGREGTGLKHTHFLIDV